MDTSGDGQALLNTSGSQQDEAQQMWTIDSKGNLIPLQPDEIERVRAMADSGQQKIEDLGQQQQVVMPQKNQIEQAMEQAGLLTQEEPASSNQVIYAYQCQLCEEVSFSKEDFETHSLMHMEGALFKCQLCEQLFTSKDILDQHECQMVYSCEECEDKFDTQEGLDQHMLIHHIKTEYKCPVCDEIFQEDSGLILHMEYHGYIRINGMVNTSYKCKTCGETMHKDMDLRSHQGEHVHICRYCNKQFEKKAQLDSHQWQHMATIKCVICKIEHSSLKEHKIHMMKKHPYLCVKCVMDFKSQVELATHRLQHTHACNICKEVFKTKYQLDRHMFSHTKKCTICGVKYFENARHIHRCMLCGLKVEQDADFESHRQEHKASEPLRCDHCTSFFQTEAAYAQHVKKHQVSHNGKSIDCIQCGEVLFSDQELAEHQLTKHGHTCKMCGDVFSKKSQLDSHQWTHWAK